MNPPHLKLEDRITYPFSELYFSSQASVEQLSTKILYRSK